MCVCVDYERYYQICEHYASKGQGKGQHESDDRYDPSQQLVTAIRPSGIKIPFYLTVFDFKVVFYNPFEIFSRRKK